MKKHSYQLIINQGKPVANPVIASFGNNYHVELHIMSKGIVISTLSSSQKDPKKILEGEDALFSDALKKVLVLYTIRYNRYINITTATVVIDNKAEACYSHKETGFPLVYSLSEGNLREPFSKNWNAEGVTTTIVHKSSSKYDGCFTALHALLTAKANRYEIERFTYYWMAMNGLYNYIASKGEKIHEEHEIKGQLAQEFQKQDFMIRCYGYEPLMIDPGDRTERKLHERRILWHLFPVIRSIPEEDIEAFCKACLESDETNEYVKRLFTAIDRMNEKYEYKERYSVFPLMVVWLPYKIRCGSFHGENALPTFCFRNDKLVRVLRVMNKLLDVFLTEQLPIWLNSDESAITETQKRLEAAALNPAYKTKKQKKGNMFTRS